MSSAAALPARVAALHAEVRSTPPALCAERAVLVTRYHRHLRGKLDPVPIRKAKALAHVLERKAIRIWPRELLVGTFTSHRVGGGLFPELHGVAMLEDLFRFDRRGTNPFTVTTRERLQLLLEVIPYWAPRFLALRSGPPHRVIRFLKRQLSPVDYLINESGGISHFVPDLRELLARGTESLRKEAAQRRRRYPRGSSEADFLRAVEIACKGLEDYAEAYRRAAVAMADRERDAARREELLRIAEVCGLVPRYSAKTFHEALQSVLFAQIALNLESLDNSVSPGRLDQVLFPYYRRDLEAGRIDRQGALELLGCFAVKLCEIVPAFSERLTRFHGGLFNGQVVVVGGQDEEGDDATNDLTHLCLDLMDLLRTRQPNWHARLHAKSPPGYRDHVARVLSRGSAAPALYNDDVIVGLLTSRGVSPPHARDYANVGCVEPVAAGRSFFSTDAALVNLPLCLELALNEGRRFGHRRRLGAATGPAGNCANTEDLARLLDRQVAHLVRRLLSDLRAIERANARLHPTPFTSLLLRGCLEEARDATAGGAQYDGSGIQGVGVVEVGDSLAAIERVVFRDRHATLSEVVQACRMAFRGCGDLQARLRNAPKYGNDDPDADRWVARALEIFASHLLGETNTRGGAYAAGFYSVTAHEAFGRVVGALPSGRGAGEPYASGLSPSSGAARRGPTAALSSCAGLPLHLAQNGVNFNLEIAPWATTGIDPAVHLRQIVDGAFDQGCMQVQVNVLDPALLVEARDNPGRHPHLLVRVSGYSAYFDDLSPEMQQEIIDRNRFA